MIEEAQMEFEYSIRYVEHLTGLTPVALGGTPDPKALKSTTELSYSATQNVMRPIVGGIMALKQRISESIVLRTQMLLKNNEEARKAYTRIIGKIDVQAMLTAEQNNVAYGLMLKPQPDAGERERIYNMLTEAMALGRDGVKSIELDDALMIEEMLDKKMDLTEIRMLLSYKIRKYKEEKRAEAIQGQQIEAQKNERLEQVKAQNKAKDEQAEWERKKAELMLEKQSEERQLNIEHNNRLREDVMKYAHEEDMQERELKAENNG